MANTFKKSFALAGASLIAASCCFTACGGSKGTNGSFQDYEYEYNQNTLKTECDADTKVDGVLDEARWTVSDLKWVEHHDNSTDVFYKFTTTFGEKGVYFAAVSEDWRIYYNAPYVKKQNTTFDMFLARQDDSKFDNRVYISFNCGNTPWARGLYAYLGHVTVQGGEPNSDDCTGMTLEAFVPWSQLGYKQTPDYNDEKFSVKATCLYQIANASDIRPGYSSGSTFGKYFDFGKSGYLSADGAEGTLGDSKSGYAKGPNWNVDKAGAESEVYTSDRQTLYAPGQTYIFYRDVYSENYRIEATFKPNLNNKQSCGIANDTPKAGLMTGFNEVCFSALMIDYRPSYIKENVLVLTSSFTNSNQTTHTPIYKSQKNEYGDLSKGITLACVKYGSLFYYYVVTENGSKLVYQEEIELLSGMAEPGIQTTNCNVTVTKPGYSYSEEAEEEELLAHLNDTGIYTVKATNKSGGSVTPQSYSVRKGEDLVLNIAPTNVAYKMTALEISRDGEKTWENITADAVQNTTQGKYTIKNIDSNISIQSTFARHDSEVKRYNVSGSVKGNGKAVSSAVVALENKADKSMYYKVNLNNGSYGIQVPEGEYTMFVTAQGYLSAQQSVTVKGGAVQAREVNLQPTVLGGSVTVNDRTLESSTTRCTYSEVDQNTVGFGLSGNDEQVAWLSKVGAVSGDFTVTAVFDYIVGADDDPSAGFTISDGKQLYNLYALGGNNNTGFRFYHPADSTWNNRYQNRKTTTAINYNTGKIIITLKRENGIYSLYSNAYQEGATKATTLRGSVKAGISHDGICVGPGYKENNYRVPEGTVAVGLSVMDSSSFTVTLIGFEKL